MICHTHLTCQLRPAVDELHAEGIQNIIVYQMMLTEFFPLPNSSLLLLHPPTLLSSLLTSNRLLSVSPHHFRLLLALACPLRLPSSAAVRPSQTSNSSSFSFTRPSTTHDPTRGCRQDATGTSGEGAGGAAERAGAEGGDRRGGRGGGAPESETMMMEVKLVLRRLEKEIMTCCLKFVRQMLLSS